MPERVVHVEWDDDWNCWFADDGPVTDPWRAVTDAEAKRIRESSETT